MNIQWKFKKSDSRERKNRPYGYSPDLASLFHDLKLLVILRLNL